MTKNVFIALMPDRVTKNKLQKFCKERGLDISTAHDKGMKFDFHVTLLMGKPKEKIKNGKKFIKKKIRLMPKAIGIFGQNSVIPIIKFEESEELLDLRNQIIDEYDIDEDKTFDEYVPHLSLTYNWQGKEELNVPEFTLVFDAIKFDEQQ